MRTGIKGNAGIVAKFAVQPAGVDTAYDEDIKNMRITSDDKDDADLTFADAAAGETKDYNLAVTAVQSTATGSFWRLLWDNPGAEFAVTYGPHGNAVATADQPHFLMTVKANGRPEIGGEASRGSARYDFEYTLEVTSGPTLDDGTP